MAEGLKRATAYLRVSTDEQAASGLAPGLSLSGGREASPEDRRSAIGRAAAWLEGLGASVLDTPSYGP